MHLRLLSFPLLAVAACAGDPAVEPDAGPPVATFANATEAQIYRAYEATALDAFGTYYFGAAAFDVGSCPQIAVDGNLITYTGGCRDRATTFDGSWTSSNYPTDLNPHYDAGIPTVLTYHGFRMTAGDDVVEIDGTSSVDASSLPLLHDEVATITQHGVTVIADVHLTCTSDHLCAPSPDRASSITIDGLGSATFDGSWYPAGHGAITLHGTDDLVVEPADATRPYCVNYTIGRQSGIACGGSSGIDVL